MAQKPGWGMQHFSFLWHGLPHSMRTPPVRWMLKGSTQAHLSQWQLPGLITSTVTISWAWWQNYFFLIREASLQFKTRHASEQCIYTAAIHIVIVPLAVYCSMKSRQYTDVCITAYSTLRKRSDIVSQNMTIEKLHSTISGSWNTQI